MPNHITTEITGPPAIIEHLTRARTEEETTAAYAYQNRLTASFINAGGGRFAESKTGEELGREIDFNLLIPQPENIEVGGCTGYHAPGVICWYEWNSQHWGTKWNGYNLYITRGAAGSVTIRFNTAWNHPEPIVKALSRAVPDDDLRIVYASEDLGYGLGGYTARNGAATETQEFTEGSDEACEFAAQLIHHTTYAKWQQD